MQLLLFQDIRTFAVFLLANINSLLFSCLISLFSKDYSWLGLSAIDLPTLFGARRGVVGEIIYMPDIIARYHSCHPTNSVKALRKCSGLMQLT